MSLEDRLSDALDAAGRAHDRPADLLDGVQARIEADRRRRRVAALGGGAAAVGAAAAIAAFVLLDRTPGDERVQIRPADTTTTSAIPTTSLPMTTTTAAPPAPPETFVGLRDDFSIVLAEAATGRVVRTLYTREPGFGVASPVFDPKRENVYFATLTDYGAGQVWKVPAAGGEPVSMFPGCAVSLSPDGNKAAVIGGTTGACRDGITVHDLAGGAQPQFFGRGSTQSSFLAELAWTKDARSVLFAAAEEEMPTRLYRLDITTPGTLDNARKLGPAGETANSWSSAELMPATGMVKLIEYCCMVDAEPPPSDISDVMVIDAATGKEIDRWRTPQDVSSVRVAANGASAELYVGSRNELYRREGDNLRRLPGTWRSIDW